MPRRKTSKRRKSRYQGPVPAPRELIAIVRQEAAIRAIPPGVLSMKEFDVGPLNELLKSEGATLKPLFGVSEDRLRYEAKSLAAVARPQIPDLSVYYRVQVEEKRLNAFARKLRKLKSVEAAYVKPPTFPAQFLLKDLAPIAEEPPEVTPDFTSHQEYLNQAPGGIDASYAWGLPGGKGANVQIIDIEGAWNFSHEDLLMNQGGVVGGTPEADMGWRNHGTAVIGEFGGDTNPYGVTGICPDANVRAISIFGEMGSAAAIRQAANMLRPGDIILIELHRQGPVTGDGQFGFIAIEWWPDDFAVIQYAINRGVIVVEAAGNGFQNLDDPIYNTPISGFPSDWLNPFNRANRDSGAILVGAGNPPAGTHGLNSYNGEKLVDRARCKFSNYGTCVDVQGWGWLVTTTGYGDLQGGPNENFWYTDEFSGTSSASPIVVGALGCVQGNRRATGNKPYMPAQARNLLRTTGSPQQAAQDRPVTQRIGNRPDLRQLI